MALKGDFHTVYITTILQMLSDENKTGVLRARNPKNNQVKLFLQDGAILCVMGTLKRARLGSLLQHSNLITPEILLRCLAMARERGQALGKVLIEEEVLTAEKLGAVVNKQAEEIIFNLLAWESGTYEYQDGRINLRDMVIVPINVMGLILEGLRRKDERTVVEAPTVADPTPPPRVDVAFTAGELAGAGDSAGERVDAPPGRSDDEIALSESEWRTFWRPPPAGTGGVDVQVRDGKVYFDGVGFDPEPGDGSPADISATESEWKRFLAFFKRQSDP
jgi:hypothetical protein